ncbi:MAG: SGNH/GDSL hydrolase family protein [Planctomycetota bacterium]
MYIKFRISYIIFLWLILPGLNVETCGKTNVGACEPSIIVTRPEKEDPDLKNVLFLGDNVMFSYKPELLKLIGTRANCTFISMPKSGDPDWNQFSQNYINTRTWDLIHFSYGRELMLHVDADGNPDEKGTPRGNREKVYGIYIDLIQTLSGSEAFLIGCTTTPVRGSMPGYKPGVDWEYGSRFQQMLGPYGIKINDLGDYTRTRRNDMVRNHSNLPTNVGTQLMAEQVANSVFEAFNEGVDLNRPRILLVGDSIVGGYYGATRDLFSGIAVVYSGGTTYNDPNPDWKQIVDQYIEKGGERGWDVIQFNWGLHAVKYVDENNKDSEPGKPGSHIQFTVQSYLNNIERFAVELKRTNAKLVFATTTPVPEGSTGSIQPIDLALYNDPAIEIMKEHEILVNDLYLFSKPRLKELQIKDNVHFTSEGSKELAKQNFKVLSSLLDQ